MALGLIVLLHGLGMERRKSRAMSRKLDPSDEASFIRTCYTNAIYR